MVQKDESRFSTNIRGLELHWMVVSLYMFGSRSQRYDGCTAAGIHH